MNFREEPKCGDRIYSRLASRKDATLRQFGKFQSYEDFYKLNNMELNGKINGKLNGLRKSSGLTSNGELNRKLNRK